MQIRLTLRSPATGAFDIEVMTRAELAVSELSDELAQLVGASEPISLFSRGRPLPPHALLGGPGLRNGCLLTLSADTGHSVSSPSLLELRVISGPDSGIRVPLSRGDHLIGRAGTNDVPINDDDISREHAVLTVELGGLRIRDQGSTNGTRKNGLEIPQDGIQIELGALLFLGQSVLSVVGSTEPPAATQLLGQGLISVNRPPRLAGVTSLATVDFPALPVAASRPATQWFASLVPAVLGIGLAIAMHNPQFLAFALLSPISLAATAVSDRRSWRRGQRSRTADLHAAEKLAHQHLTQLLAAETARRRRSHPDAAAVSHTAATADCRLWERRPSDADFLTVRIASSDLPAQVGCTRAGAAMPPHVLEFVPVVLSLAAGAAGLAGPRSYTAGLARWLVGQLLALHSPKDVTLIALLEGDCEHWQWLRWSEARIATTADERQENLNQIVAIMNERLSHPRPATSSSHWPGPWTVLLIDPAAAVAGSPGLTALLQNGSKVGMTALLTATDPRLLPQDCRALVQFQSATGDRLRCVVAGELAITDARSEQVSQEWAEQLTRDLAPLRDGDATGPASVPSTARLIDLLELAELTPDSLLRRWSTAQGVSAPIGVSASGPVILDLLRDGPHGLIAGSTGSGKSELLRSIVAGLAANHGPEDISFLLIDYKGGAAFADCVDLPHVIAMITDLDPHLTQRALISLDAELRRREAAFAAAEVADFQSYRSANRRELVPIPRLILVVDEFASLAEELPDFITGLVSIAQRGRSLGVHLLLATQRPNGVVSPEIKANMALRIALRVIDPGESVDIIGSGAAATIAKTLPGRALARMGDGLVEFQTARIGLPVQTAARIGIGVLDEWNRAPHVDEPEGTKLDLRMLVDAAREAYCSQGHPAPPPVWLAPLPRSLKVATLGVDASRPHLVHLGLMDDPARQWQGPLTHDLSHGGSLGFIGGPRSGRTTALRTLGARAASQLSAEKLHLYVLDCAGGSLLNLARLGLCASAVGETEPSSVTRLISRLSDELSRRQALLAEHGLSQSSEARSAGLVMPAVLLMLDGWEGFSALSDSLDGGRSADTLLRILRDGAAAGFTVAITGDRALLGVRISAAITDKFMLALTDRSDYISAGLRQVPAEMPPGRAICLAGGRELQLATFTEPATAADEWAAISAISPQPGSAGQLDTAGAAIRIRALPQTLTLQQLKEDLALQPHCSENAGRTLLGLGDDDAVPISVDLFRGDSRFLIAGPARSGRSTAACLIAAQLHADGIRLAIAAPPRSPLAAWATAHEVAPIAPDQDHFQPSMNADFLIVDDADAFADTPAGTYLLDYIGTSSMPVIACARAEDLIVSFRGIAVAVRRSRTGILLQPQPMDAELLAIRLPAMRTAPIAGRAILVTDEIRTRSPHGIPIQLALPDGPSGRVEKDTYGSGQFKARSAQA